MNAIAAVLFFTLIGLAVLHFLYQAVFLPVLRLRLRYKLFYARDGIRNALSRCQNQEDQLALEELHSSVNTIQRWVDLVSMSLLNDAARRYNQDAGFREVVDRRNAVLNRAHASEVEQYRSVLASCVLRAAIINGGAWFIYLLPALVLEGVIETIRTAVRQVVVLDEEAFDSLVPSAT